MDGLQASYLTAGEEGPLVPLRPGTYWSRVWAPVVDRLADAGAAERAKAEWRALLDRLKHTLEG